MAPRQQTPVGDDTPRPRHGATSSHNAGTDIAPRNTDPVLVPLPGAGVGTFLVLGGHWPARLGKLEPLADFPTMNEELLRQLAPAIGAANAGAQAAAALQSAHGVVRLAPDTLAALEAGAVPVTSGGWNLGVLATSSGKFATQVRWLPATAATMTGTLASVGPALGLLALQWLLAQVSRQVETSNRIANDTLRELRTEKWAAVRSDSERLQQLFDQASFLGAVTPETVKEARGLHQSLSRRRVQLLNDARHHRQALGECRTLQARRAWMREHAAPMLTDIQALVLASQGCFLYEAMRANSLFPVDPRHADKVGADAVSQYQHDRELVGNAVVALTRLLDTVAHDPGPRGLAQRYAKPTPNQIATAASALAEVLRTMQFPIEEPLMAAELSVLGDPEDWSDEEITLAGLLLDPGERLLGMFYGHPGEALFLTDRRLLSTHEKAVFTVVGDTDPNAVTEYSVRRRWSRVDVDYWVGDECALTFGVSLAADNEDDGEAWAEDVLDWAIGLQAQARATTAPELMWRT